MNNAAGMVISARGRRESKMYREEDNNDINNFRAMVPSEIQVLESHASNPDLKGI